MIRIAKEWTSSGNSEGLASSGAKRTAATGDDGNFETAATIGIAGDIGTNVGIDFVDDVFGANHIGIAVIQLTQSARGALTGTTWATSGFLRGADTGGTAGTGTFFALDAAAVCI